MEYFYPKILHLAGTKYPSGHSDADQLALDAGGLKFRLLSEADVDSLNPRAEVIFSVTLALLIASFGAHLAIG
jgi:hypothetical protein